MTQLPALYVLAQEYQEAAERMADMELDEQTIADTLEGMSGALEVKATNVAAFTRNLEATAAAIKDAEAQMAARRKVIERRAESIRAYLLQNMLRASISKIEGPLFRISVRDNPPSVDVFDAALLPSDYLRIPDPPPLAPDKKAIGEALKSGTDVPGARLARSQRLEIK
jgi:hypothetical protein